MGWLTRVRTALFRLPAWAWLAVALSMLIAGLWLAYFVVVNRPPTPAGTVQTVPTYTATPAATGQTESTAATDDTASAVTATGTVSAPAAPTDTPSPTPLSTDTSTPPPAPTQTSTPVPEQRLVQGAEFYRLGDYAAARAQFSALLTSDATPRELRLRAQYELAKSYLAEELFAEALAILDQLQAEGELGLVAATPDSAQDIQAKAEYLRAEALYGLGRNDEAAGAYTRFLQSYPSAAAAVQPRLGRIYLAQGNVEVGNAAFSAAVAASTDAVHRVLLLEELAEIHTGAGRHAEAAAAYNAILDIARQPHYRTEVLNKAGQSLAAAGDESAAIERWRTAIAEAQPLYQSVVSAASSSAAEDVDEAQRWLEASIRSRATNAAYEALVELINRNVEFDLHERGVIDLKAEAYGPAVNAFSAYLDSVAAADPRAPSALHGLGQAQLGAGDYAAAQATFERVLNEYPDCACLGEVKLDMARTQAAQGDSAGARRSYRTFARDDPADPLAPEALWRSGISALNEGSNLEGAVDLLALADAFPDSELAPQALFWVGTGAYHNQLYKEAGDAYGRLQREYPDHRWDAVAYWLGRALHAQGDIDAANQTWAALADRAPDVYYGILAAYSLHRISLSGGSMLTSMGAIAGSPTRLDGDGGGQAFAEQWLADWLQLDPAMLATLPEVVANDPDLLAGRILIDLGARGDALEALERVYRRSLDDPQALYALSLEFERLGAYRLSLIAMSHLLQLSPANMVEDAPIFLQQRVYPRPFADLITEQAIAHNLDPLLLFSLIRQESLFEEGARSVAAAQGLAQIIPPTGEWIAEQVSYPNYTNDLVYRPIVNVRFGAYYLDWVRDYLDGNLVSALAGYNAGPGNSQRWRESSGPDDTRFVEILDYTEPRIYIKAIASNLYHYNRLYRAQP